MKLAVVFVACFAMVVLPYAHGDPFWFPSWNPEAVESGAGDQISQIFKHGDDTSKSLYHLAPRDAAGLSARAVDFESVKGAVDNVCKAFFKFLNAIKSLVEHASTFGGGMLNFAIQPYVDFLDWMIKTLKDKLPCPSN